MREWWQRREERVSPLLTSVKRDPPLKICARFIFTLSYIELFFFPPLVFHSPGLYTLIYAVAHGNTRDRERKRENQPQCQSQYVTKGIKLSARRNTSLRLTTASIWYLKARRTVRCTRIMQLEQNGCAKSGGSMKQGSPFEFRFVFASGYVYANGTRLRFMVILSS